METGIRIQGLLQTGKDTENWGFDDGSVVKNMPVMQETQIQSLSWEYPLEKGMAPRGQQEMGDCSPEVLATSSEQQRPSIVTPAVQADSIPVETPGKLLFCI